MTQTKTIDNFIELKTRTYDLSGPSEWLRKFTIGWQNDYEVLNLFNYGIEKDFPSQWYNNIIKNEFS